MSSAFASLRVSELRHDLAVLRGEWGWFMLLGFSLVVLGIVAMASPMFASLATAIFFGMLLMFGGLAEIVGAFWCRAWSGFFFHFLGGVLSAVVGGLFLAAPADAVLTLSLLLAALFLVGGIFNVVASISYRFTGWGLVMLAGVIDIALGVMIWQAWPAAAFWVIGLFVGINVMIRGFNWIVLGMALRSLPKAAPAGMPA